MVCTIQNQNWLVPVQLSPPLVHHVEMSNSTAERTSTKYQSLAFVQVAATSTIVLLETRDSSTSPSTASILASVARNTKKNDQHPLQMGICFLANTTSTIKFL